jgi:hypothetical protein
MIGELANHLWQSTVFVVAAALLTLMCRKNHASVRYWLWFSASVKFFERAGFALEQIVPTPSPLSIVIGKPIV